LVGRAVFPEGLHPQWIGFIVAFQGVGPEIPDFVPQSAAALITDCLADDPDDRPTFAEILDRLRGMEFKLMENRA
jgi:hypothetical protein